MPQKIVIRERPQVDFIVFIDDIFAAPQEATCRLVRIWSIAIAQWSDS
jgi:hypothetical protein